MTIANGAANSSSREEALLTALKPSYWRHGSLGPERRSYAGRREVVEDAILAPGVAALHFRRRFAGAFFACLAPGLRLSRLVCCRFCEGERSASVLSSEGKFLLALTKLWRCIVAIVALAAAKAGTPSGGAVSARERLCRLVCRACQIPVPRT